MAMRKSPPSLLLGAGTSLALMTGLFIAHGSTSTPLVPLGAVAHADDAPATTAAPDDSPEKAVVMLEKYCSGCHGEGKRLSRRAWIDRKAYANLVETQRLVIPGKPDESELYTCMTREREVMPPARVQVRPTQDDLAAIKTWIANGAKPWAATPPEAPAEAAPAN